MEKQINVWVNIDNTFTQTKEKIKEILNVEGLKYTEQTKNQIVERIDFYNNIQTYEDSINTINKRRWEKFYHFNIYTKGTQQHLLNKYNWIMNNLHGDLNIYGVLLGRNNKPFDMKNSINIDSNINVLKTTNAAIKIFFNPKNKIHKNIKHGIYVVNNWKEIEEMLVFYESQGGII